MFKVADVKIATALLIGGFLRGNEGESDGPTREATIANERKQLGNCLTAIVAEVGDWAEGLPDEHPLRSGQIDGVKPYDMATELVALVGIEEATRLLESAACEGWEKLIDPTGPGSPAWSASETIVEAGKRMYGHLAQHGRGHLFDGWVLAALNRAQEEVAQDAAAAAAMPAIIEAKPGREFTGKLDTDSMAVALIDALGADGAQAALDRAIKTPREV